MKANIYGSFPTPPILPPGADDGILSQWARPGKRRRAPGIVAAYYSENRAPPGARIIDGVFLDGKGTGF
jgi:hypothetical protein